MRVYIGRRRKKRFDLKLRMGFFDGIVVGSGLSFQVHDLGSGFLEENRSSGSAFLGENRGHCMLSI